MVVSNDSQGVDSGTQYLSVATSWPGVDYRFKDGEKTFTHREQEGPKALMAECIHGPF